MINEFYPASMSRNLVRVGRCEYSDNMPLNPRLLLESHSSLHITALASLSVLDHQRKATHPSPAYKL